MGAACNYLANVPADSICLSFVFSQLTLDDGLWPNSTHGVWFSFFHSLPVLIFRKDNIVTHTIH